MRILHLAWEYPPVVHGGLGRYVDAVSRAQTAAGHDVHVLAPADDLTDPDAAPAPLHEVRAGVSVARVRLPAASGFIDAMTQLQREMTSAARELADVDVVHAHDWMVAEAAKAVADVAACPLVVTVHATEFGRRFGRLDDELHHRVHAAERQAIALADRVVVSSTQMRDEAVAHGAVAGLVHVVPGGVEADRWQVDDRTRRDAHRRWCSSVEHLVVAAGRLEWEKGFSTLLRALPAVLRGQPSTRVVIAGQGSYEPVLRRLADDLGVGTSVDLPGRLGTAELAALFAAADAVVVPSRYEPFGLVALEAQAAGAPVVVSRTGGLAENVEDGVTGRVIEPGDVDHLAEILIELGANPLLREGLATAGQERAAARTWSVVARQLDDVYVAAAGRAGPEHVVAATWICRRGAAVLGARPRQSAVFFLPGGIPEPGETLAQAVVREVREEVGVLILEADLKQAARVQADAYGRPGAIVDLVCFTGPGDGEPVADGQEIVELAWLEPSEWHLFAPPVRLALATLAPNAGPDH